MAIDANNYFVLGELDTFYGQTNLCGYVAFIIRNPASMSTCRAME